MTTKLSPRQTEIVILVGKDGAGWATVARRMGIAYGTVISYARTIQLKTGTLDKKPRDAMAEVYWTRVHRF